MIAKILPSTVVAVEAREDRDDIQLFPEEQAVLARSVEKRRREFATARDCAHLALRRLGLAPAPVTSGPRGEPRWPAGIVGSITHCTGYRACALARVDDLPTIGIDAEPNQPLPDGVLAAIARPEELARVMRLAHARPEVCWDRLLFSAKESIYKAWFPLTGISLSFEDATLDFDVQVGSFSAHIASRGARATRPRPRELAGRWLAHDGPILTAVAPSNAEFVRAG